MIKVGKIISSARDAAGRLLVNLLIDGIISKGEGDLRTPKQIAPFGIDSNPIAGKRVVYLQSGKDGRYYVAGILNTKGIAETGEIRFFSTDDDEVEQMFLHLKKDGTAEFGGDDDNLMRFAPAKDGFDELREDLNDLIIKFNTHVHPTTTPGAPTGVTPTAGAASTASINDSKIDEIKTLG